MNLFQGITLYRDYPAVSLLPDAYDSDGGAAAWLMQTFLPVVNAAMGSTRQIDGAALQLAIWDTIHDGGDGFAIGRVRSTGNTNDGWKDLFSANCHAIDNIEMAQNLEYRQRNLPLLQSAPMRFVPAAGNIPQQRPPIVARWLSTLTTTGASTWRGAPSTAMPHCGTT